VFVINKADMPGARDTRRDLEQMLELSAPSDWRPPVVQTIAATGEGVDELWDEIGRHQHHLQGGALERVRAERIDREFRNVLAAGIRQEIERLERDELEDLVLRITEHRIDPYDAAERLLEGIRRRVAGAEGSGAPSS
jgi:GTPase